jgi:hypothetical protein
VSRAYCMFHLWFVGLVICSHWYSHVWKFCSHRSSLHWKELNSSHWTIVRSSVTFVVINSQPIGASSLEKCHFLLSDFRNNLPILWHKVVICMYKWSERVWEQINQSCLRSWFILPVAAINVEVHCVSFTRMIFHNVLYQYSVMYSEVIWEPAMVPFTTCIRLVRVWPGW